MNWIRRLLLAAAMTVAGLLMSSTVADAGYTFVSFDGPGNNAGGTTVNGINNNGFVVGFSSDNANNPTLFTNFVRNPDGTFTTLNIGGDPLANANGINSGNQVVGTSNNNAFFLSNNFATLTTLPAANPGNTAMEVAFGINDKGSIVGQYTDNSTDTTPGFVYANGKFTILNPTPGAIATNAQGINNNGLVIGFYSLDGVHQHGFLYNTLTSAFTLIADPNVSNLVLTQFLGINDKDQAVGYYQLPDGSQHGFVYNVDTQSYSFLDDPNAAKTGFSITQITGINNSGEIAGFYVDTTTGFQRGFVANPVPEPGSVALLGVGLASVLGYSARRRLKPTV